MRSRSSRPATKEHARRQHYTSAQILDRMLLHAAGLLFAGGGFSFTVNAVVVTGSTKPRTALAIQQLATTEAMEEAETAREGSNRPQLPLQLGTARLQREAERGSPRIAAENKKQLLQCAAESKRVLLENSSITGCADNGSATSDRSPRSDDSRGSSKSASVGLSTCASFSTPSASSSSVLSGGGSYAGASATPKDAEDEFCLQSSGACVIARPAESAEPVENSKAGSAASAAAPSGVLRLPAAEELEARARAASAGGDQHKECEEPGRNDSRSCAGSAERVALGDASAQERWLEVSTKNAEAVARAAASKALCYPRKPVRMSVLQPYATQVYRRIGDELPK